MSFHISKLLNHLPGDPAFRVFSYRDENPLQGTVKFRRIHDPNEPMRIVHERLIARLRDLDFPMPRATGARPGCSPLKNVLRHRKSRYFYLLDIHSAYLGVSLAKLADILCTIGFASRMQLQDVEAFLRRYCGTFQGTGLAIGAPASPDLFNLYAAFLVDQRLTEAGKRYGFMYSRYLDDLTFSSFRKIGCKKRKVIRSIILEAGFEISHRKAHVYDLKKGPITINGVGLELGGRVFLPRHYLRRITGKLHVALAGKPVSPAELDGLMGVFWATIDRRLPPNASEQRVIRMYQRYRELASSSARR